MKVFKLAMALVVLSIMTVFTANAQKSIYDFKINSLEGEQIDFSQYKGKVLLIVNVASKCGLTPQYEGLEKLYEEYKEKGLEILAFPCNQFLGQEPGDAQEIRDVCLKNYGVSFQVFEKINVNGKDEHALYTFLKKKAPFKGYPDQEFGKQLDGIHQKLGDGFDKGDNIRWNFGKFLISKDGKTIQRFEPMVSPQEIEQYIIKML